MLRFVFFVNTITIVVLITFWGSVFISRNWETQAEHSFNINLTVFVVTLRPPRQSHHHNIIVPPSFSTASLYTLPVILTPIFFYFSSYCFYPNLFFIFSFFPLFLLPHLRVPLVILLFTRKVGYFSKRIINHMLFFIKIRKPKGLPFVSMKESHHLFSSNSCLVSCSPSMCIYIYSACYFPAGVFYVCILQDIT